MSITKGVYTGPRKELKGHYALLRPTRGGNWLAQFDCTKLREAFGWHYFHRRHFKIVRYPKRYRTAAHRRRIEKDRIREFVATMKKWSQTASCIRSAYERTTRVHPY